MKKTLLCVHYHTSHCDQATIDSFMTPEDRQGMYMLVSLCDLPMELTADFNGVMMNKTEDIRLMLTDHAAALIGRDGSLL